MHLFIINDAVSRKQNSMGNKGAVNNVPITESTFCPQNGQTSGTKKRSKTELVLTNPLILVFQSLRAVG